MKRTNGKVPEEKYKEWGFADKAGIAYVELQYKMIREGMTLEQYDYLESNASLSTATSIAITQLARAAMQKVRQRAVEKQINAAKNNVKTTEDTGGIVDSFIKNNVNPEFQSNVKNAFCPDAKVTTLTQDKTVYRYHGGTSTGTSYWYTPNQTANPAADLALPPGNTYQYMDTYIIPKGTTIIEGTVAPNFGQPGGGYQYFVPDPSVIIIN